MNSMRRTVICDMLATATFVLHPPEHNGREIGIPPSQYLWSLGDTRCNERNILQTWKHWLLCVVGTREWKPELQGPTTTNQRRGAQQFMPIDGHLKWMRTFQQGPGRVRYFTIFNVSGTRERRQMQRAPCSPTNGWCPLTSDFEEQDNKGWQKPTNTILRLVHRKRLGLAVWKTTFELNVRVLHFSCQRKLCRT